MSCQTVIVEVSAAAKRWLQSALDLKEDVDWFTSMEDAVTFLENSEPSIVFLDLNLKDSTASETISKIPSLCQKGHSVLVLTDITDQITIRNCIIAGALGVICKGNIVETMKAQWLAAERETIRVSSSRAALKKMHLICEEATDDSGTLGSIERDSVCGNSNDVECVSVSKVVS